ncbi:3-phosphoshikimate 1-carboxyvinyltransferase [Desulfuribacillus stibiiarsenatis]|uniref:3-phosphoshikimate 1-carboxyvinyltransferase n=1 Tax=Desulfuribacillus stibiiarsenatis TaxID=1390249 RepID=A0A1E5L727_9FIRM|nr:3-phosphoshikimate 1-carboxyvinyltransferase [Desulfuribacillus stibiiarsenatis]OEH85926.1 3-phosphoshikimate 1-carboxyvinyltransferase [Desulfuribacillus stibiiarsenatis]
MGQNNKIAFHPISTLTGECEVPGDKSISHRAVIFGSISKGITEINNFLPGLDCISTISCFQKLGVEIKQKTSSTVIVKGVGLHGLLEPYDVLDVGNSGTTIRLLTGLLSGTKFYSVLTGDSSIRKRPMKRVKEPLQQMGANLMGRDQGNLAPITIIGAPLQPMHYHSPVASAQVKSSILLAGLWVDGQTVVTEPTKSRDHTERMYTSFGGSLHVDGNTVTILGGSPKLEGQKVNVPGDISSAAFLMVAASIIPNSEICIRNVGMNPTRSGIVDALLAMNADIEIINERKYGEELVADFIVRSSNLIGTEISGDIIPRLIDEIPVLLIAATQAKGKTVIRDAKELRVKETDRIQVMHDELLKLGVITIPREDGMEIDGEQEFTSGTIYTHHDHRIGMCFAIAGCVAKGPIFIEDYDAVKVSFPNFTEVMNSLGAICE